MDGARGTISHDALHSTGTSHLEKLRSGVWSVMFQEDGLLCPQGLSKYYNVRAYTH